MKNAESVIGCIRGQLQREQQAVYLSVNNLGGHVCRRCLKPSDWRRPHRERVEMEGLAAPSLMLRVFPTPSGSWTPAGYPTVQPRSDYLEMEHQIPQLRAQVYRTAPTRPPTSDASCRRSEFPATPSLGVVNLLEWLTIQRNISLTRLLVYHEEIELRNSQMEVAQGKVGEGRGASRPPERVLPSLNAHQPGSSLKPLLLGFYGGFII